MPAAALCPSGWAGGRTSCSPLLCLFQSEVLGEACGVRWGEGSFLTGTKAVSLALLMRAVKSSWSILGSPLLFGEEGRG